MAPNSCNIRAIQNITTNLIGRSKGNHPSILSLTDHFPKQLKTESNIKMVPCGIDCIGLKRNIEKELFMRVPLASFHKMKLGTLLRQHFSLRWDGMNLTLSTGCKNCEELAKKVCLQNGNKLCHGGKVNMTEVMKIMKILFHLATPRDLTFLSDILMKASFTWKTVTIDEVNFPKTILSANPIYIKYSFVQIFVSQENNSIIRPFFSGEITPKPVLTTRGLCFALNARSMTQIFKRNVHIGNFETVFGNSTEDDIWTGSQKIIDLNIDMQSQFLKDKTSDTAGSFW